MVFTRHMTTGSNSAASTSSAFDEPASFGPPARFTRNSINHGESSKARISPGLLDLPQEVLEKILKHLTFKNICQLRLVCRTFDGICANILNSTFLRLQAQTLQRFQSIKSQMPRRESARRAHHLACESDIIETLHMRLTLMQMSFGKHIERKHCCFFPGEILDEVYHILHYIRVTPKLHRPYKVTDELFDLSTMAMEYFKEKIEPGLPEIAYFGAEFFNFASSFPATSPHPLDAASPLGSEPSKDNGNPQHVELESESKPQSNMVLRKRIKIIKQGMKRYNNQLSLLRQDLKTCKRKTAEQEKQIAEQQRQLAEQQQQTLEYAARLDEYDKKNDEVSRKFSTLLQELNKCKTELQYWRSKSPAIPPFCTGCGNPTLPHQEEVQSLVNQGIHPEGLGLEGMSDIPALVGEDVHISTPYEIEIIEEKSLVEKLRKEKDDVNTSLQNTGNSNQSASTSRNKRKPDGQALNAGGKKAKRSTKVRSKRL